MKKAKKEKENKVEYGTVSLPLPLIKKIKKRIKGTGIPSVSAYIAFISRQILAYDKRLREKEFREIEKRLEALGY